MAQSAIASGDKERMAQSAIASGDNVFAKQKVSHPKKNKKSKLSVFKSD